MPLNLPNFYITHSVIMMRKNMDANKQGAYENGVSLRPYFLIYRLKGAKRAHTHNVRHKNL